MGRDYSLGSREPGRVMAVSIYHVDAKRTTLAPHNQVGRIRSVCKLGLSRRTHQDRLVDSTRLYPAPGPAVPVTLSYH